MQRHRREDSPEVKIKVERKGGYYILYEENLYLKGQY